MKANKRVLSFALAALPLVGQLTLPAAAADGPAWEGDLVIEEVFWDQRLQSWLQNGSNLDGAGADGVLTREEREAVTALIEVNVTPQSVDGFDRVAGGAPANVAMAVACLGGHASMISQVGTEAFGDYLVANLQAHGVETAGVFRTDKANTALAFVALDKNGDRQFSFYRKPSADLFLNEDQIDPVLLRDAGVLHFCSVDLVDAPVRQAHRRAIQIARENGAIVSFDPNVRLPLWPDAASCQAAIRQFLPLADIVKLSEEEVEFVTGISDREAAAKALLTASCRMVVITRGADGAEAWTPAGHAACPVCPGPVVDTTGAGDCFIGALLYQLLENGCTPADLPGLDSAALSRLLTFASRCSAFTVAQKGAVMPSLAQIGE